MQGRGIQIHTRYALLFPVRLLRIGVSAKTSCGLHEEGKGDAARRCLKGLESMPLRYSRKGILFFGLIAYSATHPFNWGFLVP